MYHFNWGQEKYSWHNYNGVMTANVKTHHTRQFNILAHKAWYLILGWIIRHTMTFLWQVMLYLELSYRHLKRCQLWYKSDIIDHMKLMTTVIKINEDSFSKLKTGRSIETSKPILRHTSLLSICMLSLCQTLLQEIAVDNALLSC